MTSHIRRFLGALVFALVASQLVPLPVGAVPPPAPRFLTAAIAGGGARFTTGVIEAPGTFDLAGLAFDGPADADVELRASPDGHTWTPWADGGDTDQEGPDVQSHEHSDRRATAPVWT